MKADYERDLSSITPRVAVDIALVIILIFWGLLSFIKPKGDIFEFIRPKVEIVGSVIEVKYMDEYDRVKIKEKKTGVLYYVLIYEDLAIFIPELMFGDLIEVKGFLPDKYDKKTIKAKKFKILKIK